MDHYGDQYRKQQPAVSGPWNPSRSPIYHDPHGSGSLYESAFSTGLTSLTSTTSNYNLAGGTNGYASSRNEPPYPQVSTPAYSSAARTSSGNYSTSGPGFGASYRNTPGPSSGAVGGTWGDNNRYSPTESVEEIIASPNLSDYSLDNTGGPSNGRSGTTPPGGSGKHKSKGSGGRSQRRPSNRDEFDGPHQFLQQPSPAYIAMQERDLPHLPTNLLVQEQDGILSQVNDRLSQCAFDFVAKYQFPIPLTQDMRPVERPQDREWTEWVYLLKRLATKRRIPARVLFNNQIKQFVTILENSLEMRHAAKHQSRPLKDDRNILQLISAGIQVAKILKDASAMECLDRLYISTEQLIQHRVAAAARGAFRH